MNEIKFIKYQETPGEKYHGIMTIMVNNLIYLRFKISPGKNGGHYPNIANYKYSDAGEDRYVPSFGIESNMLNEEIQECVKSNIKRIFSHSPGVALSNSGTVYTTNTAGMYAPMPQAVEQEIPF